MPFTARYGAAKALLCAIGLLAFAGCSNSANSSDDVARASVSGGGVEQCAGMMSAAMTVEEDESNYRIKPGDDLAVNFYLNTEFNDEVTVRPDGKISLRLVGEINARDLTPAQLAANIDKAYADELRDPGATVHVKGSPSRRIYVHGEVVKPGALPLQPRMTAVQAVAESGGLTPDAGADRAILMRRDACGQPYGIPFNLDHAAHEGSSHDDMVLLPGDVIVVPRSKVADIGLFVKHYFKDLLPVNPYVPLVPF